MKQFATRRQGLRVRDTLTPEEQRKRIEDMAILRCAEIKRESADRAKALRAKKHPRVWRKPYKHCETCTAMTFLVKHGKLEGRSG
jgi:hypothetical protein